jgi:hypothetical protein
MGAAMTTNPPAVAYGASPAEWSHFTDTLGIGPDLLPVVSNPKSEISPKSSLKSLGKVPSRYNADRKAVGFTDWTHVQATDRQLVKWAADSDLGICIQTRQVRAIDIDIPDAAVAAQVRAAIGAVVGPLPARCRSNSGKCLLAFRMVGAFTKRIMRTSHGPIEFLANGQQFIAVGTHPSGVRYEWEGGLPTDIPYLTQDDFEAVWQALATRWAIGTTVTRMPAVRPATPRQAGDAVADPILEFLERTGWIQSTDSQGKAHITCPWEHEHSDAGQGAPSSTSYIPVGVGGFEQGHFSCLHAHCAHRSDGDFLEATGFNTEGFEVVDETTLGPDGKPVLSSILPPAFKRSQRTGKIFATLGNAALALRRADVCGWHIAFDAFNDEIVRANYRGGDGTPAAGEPGHQWQSFSDEDYVSLRIHLAKGGFDEISSEIMRDTVRLVAREHRFDTAQVWLNRLEWDGVPRVERFWSTYFGVEESDYSRACGLYSWTALAGRVLHPGVQADMVPVLIGRQGIRKSTGIKAMAPTPETFAEISLKKLDPDLSRKLRGTLVGEIAELRGLFSTDAESIKEWITRTRERWVPKYREFGTYFDRRCVFFGTTNTSEFLGDDEGQERRWLPMVVTGRVDTDAIERDRDQLWAEGALLFANNGVEWYEAEKLAREVHAEHRISDPWAEPLKAWLDEVPFESTTGLPRRFGNIRTTEALLAAIGVKTADAGIREEKRVGRLLKGYDFVKGTCREGSTTFKGWYLPQSARWAQLAKLRTFEDIA